MAARAAISRPVMCAAHDDQSAFTLAFEDRQKRGTEACCPLPRGALGTSIEPARRGPPPKVGGGCARLDLQFAIDSAITVPSQRHPLQRVEALSGGRTKYQPRARRHSDNPRGSPPSLLQRSSCGVGGGVLQRRRGLRFDTGKHCGLAS
jgi:hypothetical protein